MNPVPLVDDDLGRVDALASAGHSGVLAALEALPAELRLAVRRAHGTAVVRRRVRLSGPILVLNAAIVAAVAIGVILVLGHHHNPPRGPATRTGPALRYGGGPSVEYPPGAEPTFQQFRHNFAILRRPQTAADRSWRPNCSCGDAARQLFGYTRFARALPGGYRVFFDLEQFNSPGQLNMAAGSYVLNYDLVDRSGNVSSSNFGPNGSFAVRPLVGPDEIVFSVVPDGVARVVWHFTCRGTPPRLRAGRGGRTGCAGLRSRTVTARVVNNVAAQRVPRACEPPRPPVARGARSQESQSAAMTDCLGSDTGHVTWYGADGRVVFSFDGAGGNLPAAPFVAGAHPAGPLHILEPSAVAGVRLGRSFATAAAALTRLLGPAADTHVAVGETGCVGDFESVWASPATALPLTIYEHDGRLAGYQYGAPVNESGLVRGPGAILSTATGLTVGDTVRTARRLYGSTFTTRAVKSGHNANGGSGAWQVAAKAGSLDGALLPTSYPMRTVTAANPIDTVGSGPTKCTIAGP
jgi:hypothetical protein